MRLMKIQPEKRLALSLLITVGLVWGQTSTSGRAADSDDDLGESMIGIPTTSKTSSRYAQRTSL